MNLLATPVPETALGQAWASALAFVFPHTDPTIVMTRFRTALPTLLLALALLPLNVASAPADTTDTLDAEADTKLKIMRLLNSETVAKQEKGVRLISHYAHTGQFDEEFYSVMVTPLNALVAQGENESLRIMAVSALYSIGTDAAMRGLKAQVAGLESERVATVAQRALAQYEADRTAATQGRTAE